MSTTSLHRVPLAFPSLLNLAALTADADAPRSWIQLAKTGAFQSNRYGKFAITRDDLTQMLSNFRNITPQAPTELPIDYDHLSMDPKKPGDGVAAGWLKAVELRADGDELWGEVEWTPEAADLIRKRAYKFVSPSFVKDHVHKDGTKIGTTLLAAAITNHPFLEGMKALTLYNASVLGDLALTATTAERPAPTVRHLAEIGQRVSFAADAERTPELTDEERGQIFLVKSTIGDGDDQFVRLTRKDGTDFGWFRVTQLQPASAPQKEENSPLAKQTVQEETMLSDIEMRSAAFLRRLPKNYTAADVVSLSRQYPEEGEAYRLAGVGAEIDTEAEPASVVSLSARPGESFDALCSRTAAERGIGLGEAAKLVGAARPDLAAAR